MASFWENRYFQNGDQFHHFLCRFWALRVILDHIFVWGAHINMYMKHQFNKFWKWCGKSVMRNSTFYCFFNSNGLFHQIPSDVMQLLIGNAYDEYNTPPLLLYHDLDLNWKVTGRVSCFSNRHSISLNAKTHNQSTGKHILFARICWLDARMHL